MTEIPGEYIASSNTPKEAFMVLSVEMLLPTEIVEHIQGSKSVTGWMSKAIARQLEYDLLEQRRESQL